MSKLSNIIRLPVRSEFTAQNSLSVRDSDNYEIFQVYSDEDTLDASQLEIADAIIELINKST